MNLVGVHLTKLLKHYQITENDFMNLQFEELDKIEDIDGKQLPLLLIAKLRTAWKAVKAKQQNNLRAHRSPI